MHSPASCRGGEIAGLLAADKIVSGDLGAGMMPPYEKGHGRAGSPAYEAGERGGFRHHPRQATRDRLIYFSHLQSTLDCSVFPQMGLSMIQLYLGLIVMSILIYSLIWIIIASLLIATIFRISPASR